MKLLVQDPHPLRVKSKKNNIFKNVFLKVHSYLGLTASLIFFSVCLSGVILLFEDEITPFMYRQEQVVHSAADHLPLDSLIHKANSVYPEKKIYRIEIQNDANRSIKVLFGAKKTGYDYVFINPYDGKVLSNGKWNDRFFQITVNFHRFLLAGDTGKAITGISCIITILISISGIYLWWPSNKKMLKQRRKIKTDASKKRLIWDLHVVGGIYVAAVLILIGLTGSVWSYDWVNRQLFLTLDGKIQKKEKVENRNTAASGDISYENILKNTKLLYPGSGKITLTMPEKKGLAVIVSKENKEKIPSATDQAYFDSNTGKLISTLPYEEQTKGNKVRKMVKPIHTGSIFGLPSKILLFIAMLIALSLPISGFIMWKNKGSSKHTKVKNQNLNIS